MVLLPIILLLVFVSLLIYYIFLLSQRHQYFSQRGIPTPPFSFFLGHLNMERFMEYTKELFLFS